ncbi:MAG: RNA polymerase sigma factor [Flavipsychrobacter sp.]
MSSAKYIATGVQQAIADITRSDAGKLVSVLTRIFGTHNIETAEDAVQDILIKALKTWQAKGIPDNPEAWLFRAAKNKAIDIIRKNRRQQTFMPGIDPLLESEYTAAVAIDGYFKDEEVFDDQLRMMFACCHPLISREGQIALILKTLCGFSVAQIARAFITSNDTIEKRLYRARQVFREHNISFEIPEGNAITNRLDNLLETIYLVFNEAYSTSHQDTLIRPDMAFDTIHLCKLLINYPATALPETYALLALLYFHTSRMPSRIDAAGNLVLMKDQDRSLWDKQMILPGKYYLEKAATGDRINRYHLEAAIAYEHCKAITYADTDWETILSYYDLLSQLLPSPIVLLNRAIAIKELSGSAEALKEIQRIPHLQYLENYYLLHAILGDLYAENHDIAASKRHFEKALNLVPSEAERRLIERRLAEYNK